MTRIFFACDVHGSEKVFMKFLNASKVYKADVIILGGDLTGKIIVPIRQQPSGSFRTNFLGTEFVVKTDQELRDLEKRIRDVGYYPYCASSAEFEELHADKSKMSALFLRLMIERVREWIKIAEERLKNRKTKCFILPGNDDAMDIGPVIDSSAYVVNPEGKVVHIDDDREMISCGYSNITPWRCPRDIDEEELAKKIETMIREVENMERCIFNFHCPPYDSQIDSASKLDEQLRPVLKIGQVEMIPAGSTAIRASIEKHQPSLGLHGHIHESRGAYKLGKTLCLNPGSEYSEGILRGVVLNLDKKGISGYLFTSG